MTVLWLLYICSIVQFYENMARRLNYDSFTMKCKITTFYGDKGCFLTGGHNLSSGSFSWIPKSRFSKLFVSCLENISKLLTWHSPQAKVIFRASSSPSFLTMLSSTTSCGVDFKSIRVATMFRQKYSQDMLCLLKVDVSSCRLDCICKFQILSRKFIKIHFPFIVRRFELCFRGYIVGHRDALIHDVICEMRCA